MSVCLSIFLHIRFCAVHRILSKLGGNILRIMTHCMGYFPPNLVEAYVASQVAYILFMFMHRTRIVLAYACVHLAIFRRILSKLGVNILHVYIIRRCMGLLICVRRPVSSSMHQCTFTFQTSVNKNSWREKMGDRYRRSIQ
jgi:hypothetical protein